MSRLHPLPIFSGWTVRAMLGYLDAAGVPWRVSARRHGLPEQLPGPRSCLPTRPYLRMVADLAAREGVRELSARASLGPDGQLKVWEPLPFVHRSALVEPSLYRSLNTLCRLSNTHTTGVAYWIAETDHSIWLCSRYLARHESWVTEQFLQARIMQLVAFVERFLGGRWRPDNIRLESGRLPSSLFAEVMACDRIQVGCELSAIEIPKTFAARPGPGLRDLDRRAADGGGIDLTRLDWPDRLRAVLTHYILGRCASLERIAPLMDTSPRTLQRALRARGLSFRSLLESARFELAREGLADPNRSVEEIGRTLGYTETTNFARAFRRTAGCSPQQFRAQLLEHGRCGRLAADV